MSDRTNANAGVRASINAKRILVDLHKKQYEKILGNERVKLGLPFKAGPDPRTKMMSEIKMQERKLEKLRKKLEELNQ